MSARDMVDFERAERVAQVLAMYPDTDEPTNLIDLLADALHWCDREGHDFDDVLRLARGHHDVERMEGDEKEVSGID